MNEEAQVDNGLPPDRKAAVAYGLEQFNMVAAERDQLRAETARLKTDLAGYKVMLEAKDAQINEMESRVRSMQLTTEKATNRTATVEAVLTSIDAVLRAHEVKAGPLIRERTDEKEPNYDFFTPDRGGDLG